MVEFGACTRGLGFTQEFMLEARAPLGRVGVPLRGVQGSCSVGVRRAEG